MVMSWMSWTSKHDEDLDELNIDDVVDMDFEEEEVA